MLGTVRTKVAKLLSGRAGTVDPFELLQEDHRKVEEMLGEMESTTERAVETRGALLAQLKRVIETHTRIEERFLYAPLKKAEETRDLILEALEEHRVVKRLLGEIDATSESNEEWAAKLKVLKENLEHHVSEEENNLFGKARSVLHPDRIETMGKQMAAAKAEAQDRRTRPAAGARRGGKKSGGRRAKKARSTARKSARRE